MKRITHRSILGTALLLANGSAGMADNQPASASQPRAVASATPVAPTGQTQSGYASIGFGNYPRVTELEQEFLGQSYTNQPLSERVARLEVKKFGKPSTGDLCDRIDKLDALSAKKPEPPDSDMVSDSDSATPAPPPATGDGTASASTAATGTGDGQTTYSPSDYGSYPRVTEIEKQFLGKSYEKDPLQVRVARLEEKEYGKTFPDEALSDRVDRLDKKANPHGSPIETADNSSGGGSKGGGMGGLGQSLLNILGSAVGGGRECSAAWDLAAAWA